MRQQRATRWTRWPRRGLHALAGEGAALQALPLPPCPAPATAPAHPAQPGAAYLAACGGSVVVPCAAGSRAARACCYGPVRASLPPCRPIMTSVTLQGTVSPRAPPPTRPHTPALPPAPPPAPVRRSKGRLWPCSCKYFKVHQTLLTS